MAAAFPPLLQVAREVVAVVAAAAAAVVAEVRHTPSSHILTKTNASQKAHEAPPPPQPAVHAPTPVAATVVAPPHLTEPARAAAE